jgi:hypothetical protein
VDVREGTGGLGVTGGFGVQGGLRVQNGEEVFLNRNGVVLISR